VVEIPGGPGISACSVRGCTVAGFERTGSGQVGCLKDRFGRIIDYLRISVIPHCNLRCWYCSPHSRACSLAIQGRETLSDTGDDRLPTANELEILARNAVQLGIKHIRLTGGEPLLRDDIVEIVRRLAAIAGLDDLSMTTNGTLLACQVKDLQDAGLKRINISLDTLSRSRYAELTGRDLFDAVWGGIMAALETHLFPVKINVVVIQGFNDDEVVSFVRLTERLPVHVRFIELMPLGDNRGEWEQQFVPVARMRQLIEQAGITMVPVGSRVSGSGPAQYWKVPGSSGPVGFISALSEKFCERCNRLRVTSYGQLMPCLHGQTAGPVLLPFIRSGDEAGLRAAIRRGVAQKPLCHRLDEGPGNWTSRQMMHIGG